MDIKNLRMPTKGNVHILSLLLPEELFEFLLGISVFLDDPKDRTFTLPSKTEIRKILIHRDLQLVEEGKLEIEEVKQKYGVTIWELERQYKQREKEISREIKDQDNWARTRRFAQAIEKAKKLSNKNGRKFR
jgi:hypothetical protein